MTLWGSGKVKREFLFVDDLARALVVIMQKAKSRDGLINIGTGEDLSIKELAEKIKDIVGFRGKIIWDKTKPDGTPRKLLDVAKLKKLGFKPQFSLDKGIKISYQWFLENYQKIVGK
jgi:GDP-L-fucose synthase